MSSRHVCKACLRGLRRPVTETRTRSLPQARHFIYSPTRPDQAPATTATTTAKNPTAPKKKDGQTVRPGMSPSIAQTVAQAIRYTTPNLAEPYIAYGATEILVRECARVADYTISQEQRMVEDEEGAVQIGSSDAWWYQEFGLQPTFNSWAQITFLHMWMLTVRLRRFPQENASIWHQQLVDHFFYLAEEKMTISHNIVSRSIRNNYLKDLFAQWRGLTIGYDEGLMEGDAILAAALWRNVCSSREDVNLVGLAEVVSYVRSVLKGLESMDDKDIASGQVVFEDPFGERDVVSMKSRLWKDLPASPAEGAGTTQTTTAGTTGENTSAAAAPTLSAATPRPTKWRKASQPAVVKGAK